MHFDITNDTNSISSITNTENNNNNNKKKQSKVTNLKRSNHVFLKSISGATSTTLRSYVIPTVEIEPEVIVIHCDTNMWHCGTGNFL